MKHKVLCIIIFLLVISTTCFGQSSFQKITPGASTRSEVAGIFGQPVRTISATLLEYNPPAGIAKVEAEYRAGSAIVERLEVYFVRPVSRPALIKQFGLAPQADARKTDAKGRLVEYFGGSFLLALTYEAADESSGVSRVGYFSRKLFESVTPELPKNSSPPSLAKPSGPAAESRPVDIPSLNANIVSLRSCVANGSIPEKDQRVYKTRFASSETMGILFELIIEHPAPGRQIDFPVSSVWYRDGAAWDTQQIEERTEADWTTTILDLGKSFKTTGKWKPGRYLVEIFIEGRKVTVGTFEVY